MTMTIKTYSELITIPTFHERFEYLVLRGVVGHSTFGSDRYLNQNFYRSKEWRRTRNEVIIRDCGCDLGILGREIHDKIYVHHMNPITVDDIYENYDLLVNPEFLICTSFNTHQAITFGSKNHLLSLPRERQKGDTKLW
jgi:hypothetical protein